MVPRFAPDNQTSGDSKSRIPFLDGLRAAAILMATASHAPYAGAGAADGWFAHQGDLGVRIFFLISGFLITTLLLEEFRATGTIRVFEFLKRRAFRLMPVYWAYLAVVAGFAAFGRYSDAPMSWIGALTYTRNVVGAGGSLTRHFWSLSIEEQFYVVWPFLLLALARRRLSAIPIFIAVAAPFAILFRYEIAGVETWRHLWLGGQSILMYYDTILAGTLVGYLRVTGVRPRGAAATCVTRLIVVVALAATLFGAPSAAWPFLFFCQAALLGGYLFSLLNAPTRFELWLFENPAAIYFGRLSYSLYVWHFLFLGFFNRGLFGPMQSLVERHWLALALLTSMASYHGLERPLRSYLNARFARPRLPVAAPPEWAAATVAAEPL